MILKKVRIDENKKIAEKIFRLSVYCPEMARETKPGNFFEIKVGKTLDPLLRRPISIGLIEKDNLIFYYKVVGRGTKMMSDYNKGDYIDILGPLGKNFPIKKGQKALVIGGGIGIAPLIYLAEILKLNNNKVKFLGGFENINQIYIEDLYSILPPEQIQIYTDDGSKGKKGYPVQNLDTIITDFDVVYSCGPEILMKKINKISLKNNKKVYHSLEEVMGCGVGVCMGCAVKTVEGYQLVCKDGPIFNGKDLSW